MTDRNQRWKRIGKKSGPGNVLDGRWVVSRDDDGWWFVVDLSRRKVCRGDYTLMRYAREAAERRAARARSERWSA